MARTAGEAQVDGRGWSLLFENGSRNRLRVGGYFAGHDSKEDLKKELRRQFWEQEQRKDGENLGQYLEPQLSVSPSPSLSGSSEINASEGKDAKAGRRRKVSRVSQGQGDQHAQNIPTLPVSYSTRSAEKKSKLEAAVKRKLAASEKRRFLAAQKKQKLANDRKFYALGMRKAGTRSSSNL